MAKFRVAEDWEVVKGTIPLKAIGSLPVYLVFELPFSL